MQRFRFSGDILLSSNDESSQALESMIRSKLMQISYAQNANVQVSAAPPQE